MDFFESQDVAHRKTGRLVVLFVLAVLSIIASVYLVVSGALIYANPQTPLFHPGLLLAVTGSTLAVVAGGSLYKIAELRGGGSTVAESLGGRRIPLDTNDLQERKILNVVEEMAIASGTPVPPVFLLEGEEGINAFAAGYTVNDAVIGVTRGSIERLSRDELQGVIAHEFSHILNGDMRLNIRLIGILHGILILGIIGYYILRLAPRSGGGGKGKGGGAGMAILAVGAGLMVVGFLGTFFGNMIKAAVSRQREYLADASAIRFTRNPQGLSGALKKIGAPARGSVVQNPAAAEVSHMFFARGIASGFSSMFATHPRLDVRIRRIDPAWDGSYPPAEVVPPESPAKVDRGGSDDIAEEELVAAGVILAGMGGEPPDDAVDQIGKPTPAHVTYAAILVRELPGPIVEAARDPFGARAVVYALLIDRKAGPRQVQMDRLAASADLEVHALTLRLMQSIDAVRPEAHLPLIDLVMPALRSLSPPQYTVFRANVNALMEADQQLELFEWFLQRTLLQQLDAEFDRIRVSPVKFRTLERLAQPCAVLLSALSHHGHDAPADVRSAFETGKARLSLPGLALLKQRDFEPEALDRALNLLDAAAFLLKRDVLEACAACVAADREVTVVEAELLRGIADSLGCPMPPLLPGQSLT